MALLLLLLGTESRGGVFLLQETLSRQEQLEQGPQPFPCVPFPLERFGQLEQLLGVLRLYAERADLCLEVVAVQETVNQLFAALPRLGGAAVDEFRDA